MLPSSFLMTIVAIVITILSTNFCRVSRSDGVPESLQTPRRERRQLLGARWLPASFKIFLAFWFLWERHSSANDWSKLTIWESSSSWHDGLPDDPPCQYTSINDYKWWFWSPEELFALNTWMSSQSERSRCRWWGRGWRCWWWRSPGFQHWMQNKTKGTNIIELTVKRTTRKEITLLQVPSSKVQVPVWSLYDAIL